MKLPYDFGIPKHENPRSPRSPRFRQFEINTNLFLIDLTKHAKLKCGHLSKNSRGLHTTQILIGEMKMKQKFFAIGAIAVLAIVGLFVFEYATLAQRPDRNAQNQRGNRQGGDRGNRGGAGMINPVSWINDSWVDLTFTIKVDDESLVKARPVYQAARDKFATKMKEIQASGDRQAAMTEMRKLATTVGKEFTAGLKEVLTAEQAAKVNELIMKRQTEQQQRMNRWRGGGERGGERGRRGGGGNQ